MKRAMNYVRGTVTLTARGLFPERLLNLCAQEGAPCWGVEWRDEHTLRLTTFRHKLSLVKKLAQRAGCEISVEGRRGLPVCFLFSGIFHNFSCFRRCGNRDRLKKRRKTQDCR